MIVPEMQSHFVAEQQYKCDRLLNEAVKVSLFDDFDNSTGKYYSKKYDLAEANVTINEIDNRIEILPCLLMSTNPICWPLSNTSGTVTLSCPLSWIMKHNLTNDSLRNLTVNSNACLANDQRYQNLSNTFWSLCITNNTDDESKTHNPQDVIVNFFEYMPYIEIVSLIGYITSLITLSVAMMIFFLFRKLWNSKNRLHMHLFATFIMKAFITLLEHWIFIKPLFEDNKTISSACSRENWICKIFTSLWNYFIIANYSWILMEALYLHNLIFFPLYSKVNMVTLYIVLGWGLPGLVVVPWIVIRATNWSDICWMSKRNRMLLLIIQVPIMMSILLNFLLFLNIVRVMYVKLKISHLQHKKMQYKEWARSTLILIPFSGLLYILLWGLSNLFEDYRIKLVWFIYDHLYIPFEGTFAALFYCLLNDKVRTEIYQAWKTRRPKRIKFLNYRYRELWRNLKNRITREQHQTEGDNGPNPADIAMRELSLQ